MEYYIAKGKRRREERAAASSKKTYQTSFQLRDTKSLEASTLNNTLITNNTSYDDSDDELGNSVYKTSLTAQRLREEQNQAKVSSTQTRTRRNSSRLLNIKSKEDVKKGSIMCSKATSTDNTNRKRDSSSNKRKAVVVSVDDDEVDDGMVTILKREFRNGRRLCLSAGCKSIAQKGGVCYRHGAKRKTCSYEGCNKHVKKGGVCVRHGAVVKKNERKICGHNGCTNIAHKGGVCVRHGAELKTCSHKGCNSYARGKDGVCAKHGAKKYTCSHRGCSNQVQRGGVCYKHGAVRKKYTCTVEGCTKWRMKEGLCTMHYKAKLSTARIQPRI